MIKEKSTARERGLDLLARVSGSNGDERPFASLEPLCPDLGRYTVEFVFGEILARPGLALSTREIVTVAALAALGTARPQLAYHIRGALNVGWSPTEVVEAIMVAAIYAGFPAALNALTVAREVFVSRTDVDMPLPLTQVPAGGDPHAKGLAMLRRQFEGLGGDWLAALESLVPDLARYVFDFADDELLARPVLEPSVKALATVAALTVLGTAAPQLGANLRVARDAGCTQEEIVEVLLQMAIYAGFPAAINGLAALHAQLAIS